MTIDWPALRAAADRGSRPRIRALFAPAGGCGRARRPTAAVVTGCNVENAVVRADSVRRVRPGQRPARGWCRAAVAVSVVAADGAPLVPCGRCRQLLLEAGGAGLLIDADRGPRQLGSLLPDAFTGTDLAERGRERRCLTSST